MRGAPVQNTTQLRGDCISQPFNPAWFGQTAESPNQRRFPCFALQSVFRIELAEEACLSPRFDCRLELSKIDLRNYQLQSGGPAVAHPQQAAQRIQRQAGW